MEERLQKFLSQAGVASRRHAEEMILKGLVKVNGKVITELGTKIDPDIDKVLVNGKRVQTQQLIYLILNKPKKYMTTKSDPRKRKTVYELLPEDIRQKVWTIGRLDYMTHGLLVFTNDGDLTQILAHPSREHEKEYEVVLDKPISDGKLTKIKTGIELDGRKTSPAQVKLLSGNILRITIHEGWNREIRRMFSVIGLNVIDLKRVRVGKLKLGDLPPGGFKQIKKSELI
ncbi:MAG: pseudouridine synthase [Acidobacteriaceae bacterium]